LIDIIGSCGRDVRVVIKRLVMTSKSDEPKIVELDELEEATRLVKTAKAEKRATRVAKYGADYSPDQLKAIAAKEIE